jgi:hypothetical protein
VLTSAEAVLPNRTQRQGEGGFVQAHPTTAHERKNAPAAREPDLGCLYTRVGFKVRVRVRLRVGLTA